MQGKMLEWIISQVLKQLDYTVASKALVAILRAGCGALKDLAARTPATVDDAIVAALTKIVDEIAAALKV